MQINKTGVIHGVGQGAAIFNLLTILGEGLSTYEAEQKAKEAISDAQSCANDLSQALATIDINNILFTKLSNAMSPTGISLISSTDNLHTSEHEADFIVFFQPIVIQIRECIRATGFCLELGIHVKLIHHDSGEVDYENILMYSDYFPVENPFKSKARLYTNLLDGKARCGGLGEWCGEGGKAVLKEEIMRGLSQIVNEFVAQLK